MVPMLNHPPQSPWQPVKAGCKNKRNKRSKREQKYWGIFSNEGIPCYGTRSLYLHPEGKLLDTWATPPKMPYANLTLKIPQGTRSHLQESRFSDGHPRPPRTNRTGRRAETRAPPWNAGEARTMARRRGPGINLPRTLGTLRAGEADGGSGEGAPAYLAEEHGDRSRAPEHADPTAEPRRANHSKPGTTPR